MRQGVRETKATIFLMAQHFPTGHLCDGDQKASDATHTNWGNYQASEGY